MKLVVFSVCKNEEENIGKVMDLVPKKIEGISEIIKVVVDDGSTDNTSGVAKEHGAIVFRNNNSKKLAYGFQFALDNILEMDFDIAVNIDGDMQFDPAEISNLVKPIIDGKADFVAANRFINPQTGEFQKPNNMPISKFYGNILGAKVVSMLTNKKFDDVTSGYRAYTRKVLLSININSKETYTQETFQLLASKRFDIVQVPVSVKYFKERKSRVVTSVFSYIAKSTLNILRFFRDFAPLKFFTILSLIPSVPGVFASVFVVIHWLNTGTFTPYKFLGFAGIYLITIGIIIFILGIVADMIDRIVNNQEKILYYSKKNYFDRKK